MTSMNGFPIGRPILDGIKETHSKVPKTQIGWNEQNLGKTLHSSKAIDGVHRSF